MKYKVFDATGRILNTFRTWTEANNFRSINRRYDWIIKEYGS